MDSPEKELTSLVPNSVFARNRKNSRHSYIDEPVVPGPMTNIIDLSTSPTQPRKRLLLDDNAVQREASPTEEELEALRRKGLATAREKRVYGFGHANGKGKQPAYKTEVEYVAQLGTEVASEKALQKRRESVIVAVAQGQESDDEGQDLCVICLQTVRDATIVGECGHKIFCFECINVWANQSRKCPLCTRPMSPFLLHELDSPVGPTKHIASNTFTRFKPSPTPCQFAADKETIAVCTPSARIMSPYFLIDGTFPRFLTTYIISLMKSIDIRSEPAVRLLADFLDERGSQGRDRRGAEHFAHEVYSFLRSPYRDLALYDAIAQYDKPEPERSVYSGSDSDIAPARRLSPVNAARGGVIDVDARSPGSGARSPARARARPRSPSIDSLPSDAESVSLTDRRRKRIKRSGRRWNEADSYIAPRSPSIAARRNWNRKDSWVNADLPVDAKRKESIAPPKASDSGVDLHGKQPSGKRPVVIPDRPAAVHRGMRGWGETLGADAEQPGTGPTHDSVPPPQTLQASLEIASQTTQTGGKQKPSLELRIFGIARRNTAPEQNDAGLVSASISKISYDTDDEERALADAIWAPESASMDHDELPSGSRTSTVQPSAGSRAQYTIKEKLKAKLIKEKMQSASAAAEPARLAPVGESVIISAPDTTVLETEAKARARLALKLRLEKEKAIAQARVQETPTDAGERAAALRAKLLEKKLANSQAVQ
ncbi:hypothetical protein QFC21_005069 [Naganishia friedmannii]|uniref:Uncharacterized protein n=1 Tax=Naganishia friedmannii TaxID=89922 RepID=A0ACC2VCK4_9TREE|nr:hypothetical protein QFC21_005069 [Naganishia friedmannii]